MTSLSPTPGLRSERRRCCPAASHRTYPPTSRTIVVLYLSPRLQIKAGAGRYIQEQRPLEDGGTVGRELMRHDGTIRSGGLIEALVCGEASEGNTPNCLEAKADVRGLRRLAGLFPLTRQGPSAASLQHVSRICGRLKDGRGGSAPSQGRCKVLRRIAKNTNISMQMRTERGRERRSRKSGASQSQHDDAFLDRGRGENRANTGEDECGRKINVRQQVRQGRRAAVGSGPAWPAEWTTRSVCLSGCVWSHSTLWKYIFRQETASL